MKNKKLIRDNIDDIIDKKGIDYKTHIADNKEYEEALVLKLKEEVEEFSNEQNEEELADILEVIHAIIDFKKFKLNDIEKIRKEKAAKNGTFKKRIISTW